ncbi:MAG: filamentous hemagglutinin N-terminal domain-containing protein [Cyanobacteria bacterium P01_F01_bin.150]
MVKSLGVSTASAMSLGGLLGGFWGLLWVSALGPEPLLAQIIPDDTLGSERSHLTSNVQIDGEIADRIDGGAGRGTILFHSFSEFNVDAFQRVYFANPSGIESIFSRVTGFDVSDIMGTLGVDGNANLFFLNPNGIVFGNNARLDIAGSFMATTAEGFVFDNGQTFSAVDADVPPLLTVNVMPGLQWGREDWGGGITSSGHLSVGEDLTLTAGKLDLRGWIQSGGDLYLQGLDTVTIRDSLTAPFIAAAEGTLTVQGDRGVDIFALNHGDSGLFSGGNLTLRSGGSVIGDAHYWSGGDFRIEQLDGSALGWSSIVDPVIRSAGDVVFDDYTGASLHILAGGSVTAGDITITGPDTLENSLQERVTLSDGVTVVDIDGNREPTLDIRAGTLAFNSIGTVGDITGFGAVGVETRATATSADISVRNIRNEGGLVFLSNQYQSDLSLAGGDIQVGAIDTSVMVERVTIMEPLTEVVAQGGDVVMDARGGIEILASPTDGINTSAQAIANLAGQATIRDVTVVAKGGDAHLMAQAAMTMGNLNTSATATVEVDVQQPETIAGNVTGGRIENLAVGVSGGSTTLMTDESITIGNLDSSANTEADAFAFAFDFIDEDQAMGGTIERMVLNMTGGAIALQAGDSITTGDLYAGVNADADASVFASADTGTATGGTIEQIVLTSEGGAIALEAGDSIATGNLNTFADAVVGAFARTEALTATGGTIEQIVLDTTGGAIALEAGDAITTGTLNTSMDADVVAFVGADAAVATDGTVGNIAINNVGGAIALEAGDAITTNELNTSAFANVDTAINANARASGGSISMLSGNNITMRSLNVSANAAAEAATQTTVLDDGREQVEGGTATAMATAGTITLATVVDQPNQEVTASIGSILTDDINASVRSNARASAESSAFFDPDSTAGVAIAGSAITQALGGSITLRTEVRTGDITAASDVGTINTFSIDSSANALAMATAEASALASPNRLNAGTAIGGSINEASGQSGVVSLLTAVRTGDSVAPSDVGTISTLDIDSSANTSAFASTNADAAALAIGAGGADNSGNAGTAIGATIGQILNQGGTISLQTETTTGDITASSDVGTIRTDSLESFAGVSTRADANADAIAAVNILALDRRIAINRGSGGTARGGTTGTVVNQSGDISLRTQTTTGTITAESDIALITATPASNYASAIDSSARVSAATDASASVFVRANILADIQSSGTGGIAVGGTTGEIVNQSGNITLSTQAMVDGSPTLTPMSGLGDVALTTNSDRSAITSSVETSVNADALAIAGSLENGGDEIGGISNTVLAQGGNIAIDSNSAISIDAVTTSATNEVQASEIIGNIGNAGNLSLSSASGPIELSPGSVIQTNVLGADGNGGNITLAAASLDLIDHTLSTTVAGTGSAGNITVDVDDDVNISSSRLLSGREAGIEGDGMAGLIDIRANAIDLNDFAFLNTSTFGPGDAGAIKLNATGGNITLVDSSLFSLTAQDGKAGAITLESAGEVRLTGNSVINTTVALGSTGTGGNIQIEAPTGVFITGTGPNSTNNGIGTQPMLEEIEPNSGFFRDENRNQIFDPAITQSIDEAFSVADSPDVAFANEVPYVTIAGNSGNSTFDTYAFTIDAVGTQVTFDIDQVTTSNPAGIDLNLRLYDAAGNELAFNDDAAIDLGNGGSASTQDPYLTYIFNQPGTYFIRVSEFIVNTLGVRAEFSLRTPGTYALNVSRVSDFLINSGITTQTRFSTPDSAVDISPVLGRSGDITINAPFVDLQNGGQISTETLRNGQAGNITLQPFANGPNLTVNIQRDGSQITASTQIDATGNSGNLTITAPNAVTLQGDRNARIAVETNGEGNGGLLQIDSDTLTIQDGITVSAQSNPDSRGKAGSIDIDTTDSFTINNGSTLSVETQGEGPAGDITINAPLLTVASDAAITATATETAAPDSQGGSIFLNASEMDLAGSIGVFSETQGQAPAGTLELSPYHADSDLNIILRNDARVSASTRASGEGGNLSINAPETISIQGDGRVAVETTGSGQAGILQVSSRNLIIDEGAILSAESSGIGAAGDIIVNLGGQLTLQGGTQVSVSGQESAIAGDLQITADSITLFEQSTLNAETDAGSGANIALTVGDRLSLSDQSRISASTNSGIGGTIRLTEVDTVLVEDSQIAATALTAEGTAGSVDIHVSESIYLAGRIDEQQRSGISVSAQGGEAGSLRVTSAELTVENGAELSVSNINEGNAGRLAITAETVSLIQDGLINAQTISGEGGNIDVEIGDRLTLTNSEISASTVDGTGGSIDVEIGDRIILTNSEISASSTDGIGGNIAFEIGDRLILNDSDILASTTNGQGGSISLNLDRPEANTIVRLRNGSNISTEATETGKAGRLRFNVATLTLSDNSTLSAETTSGRGGNIRLRVDDTLRLRDASSISSTTTSGTGGDIIVRDADTIDLDSGTIAASSNTGTAGNITVRANQLFANESDISTSTVRGTARDITVRVADTIRLTGANTQISAQATEQRGTAGNIQIVTNQVIVEDGATIEASNSDANMGGNIDLERLETLHLNNGSISVETETGQAGNIVIGVSNAIALSGPNATISAQVSNDGGSAGDITVTTAHMIIEEGAAIEASNRNANKGGDINLGQLETLTLDNGIISVETDTGEAGNIVIGARDAIALFGLNARISARANDDGGSAGGITITGPQIMVEAGAQISASNQDAKDGGDIILTGLETLELSNGTIEATTQTGQAGNINITASERVRLQNGSTLSVQTDIESLNGNSGLGGDPRLSRFRNSEANVPTAGNLSIRSDRLDVSDSNILVESLTGQAGNIDIQSRRVQLNDGEIRAETNQNNQDDGTSATIELIGLDLLLMESNSLISANASDGAEGGNIDITVNDGYIIALPLNNSDVIATAEAGRGGEINLTANQIFGFTIRATQNGLRENLTNDISASSAAGPQGVVNINTLNVDPDQGLIELPGVLSDPPPLESLCNVAVESDSEFIIIGRGGIPPTPIDLPNTMDPWEDWYISIPTTHSPSPRNSSSHTPSPPNQVQIIEAQGWALSSETAQPNASDGNLRLVAQSQTSTPTRGLWQSSGCR